MKRRIVLGLAPELALGVGVSHGEWKMQVHEGASVTEFTVSNVDSVTFHETVPPPMVVVPAGVFIVGDGVAPGGTQERQVTLTRDFHLGQYEVTVRVLRGGSWTSSVGYLRCADRRDYYPHDSGSGVGIRAARTVHP